MSVDSMTARFSGASLIPGPDSEYTDFAVVDLTDNGTVCIRGGESSITLTNAGALSIAEFILRNVSDD